MKTKIRNILTLFVTLLMFAFSQAQSISGTVSDENGPLPGASIIVKGTSNGTATDFDGKYTLNNISADAIIVVSFIGYVTQEINVAGRAIVDINLVQDANVLNEIVVTGYTAQNTRNITGSVAVIDSEVLAETTPSSLEQALQGQVSGVTVGSEGGPGGKAAVRIRGFGTVNGNDPLYVIDGVQTGQGLNEINPNDIASIQVLKDAAAASIYGIGAANGVIIITTKSGKRNQKAKFTYDGLIGNDFVPNSAFPEMATPQQLADAYWKALANDGSALSHPQYGTGTTPVLPEFINDGGGNPYSFPDNRITRANQAGTNWFDEFFNSAIVQQHNIGIQGGSETSKFFVSLGLLDQEGVAVNTSYDRYSIRANSEFDITDNFRIGETLSFSYSELIGVNDPLGSNSNQNNESQIASLYRMHPIIPVYDEGGNFAGTAGISGVGNGYNPVAVADRNKNNVNKVLRTLGSVYAEVDLFEDLKFRTTFTADLNTSNFGFFQPIDYENSTARTVNQLRETTATGINTNWYNILQYTKTFNEVHNVDAFVGTEFKKNTYKNYYAQITNFLFTEPDATYLSAGTGSQTVGGNQNKSTSFSTFGKVDYDYSGKYLFSATIRRDQSSLFEGGNQVGVFPAFSAGWRLSDDFFAGSVDVNNLLLKVSWGQVGNNSIPAGNAITSYGSNLAYNDYAGQTGYYLTNIGDPNLTWETTTTTNFGISGSFFDNSITLDLDIYKAETEDMLLAVPVDPSIYGNTVSSLYKNVGQMTNKGFDLGISYNNNVSEDFSYSIGANISHYKNNVDYLVSGDESIVVPNPNLGAQTGFETTNTVAGYPISSFVGYNYDATTRSVDTSGDARNVIGNPHPDFTYGINFNADYKNLDFSLFFQGSQGNEIYNLTKFWTDFSGFEGGKSLDYVNETRHDLTLSAADATGSSYYIEDGSYIRLKNISLGYTLNDAVTSKLGLDKIRIFLQGKNLITITDYSGLDPEINLSNYTNQQQANLEIGVDRGAYPISRSLNLGLNITF
ncbi:TonB-linked outer membrane protein, SusC/RagA family [Flaviramulus basaltis]|uniref:TonB-linked outer membrane protein, SusC/RagA family n=1 Tax=Flaviramulus basaltis TaxID=369401 RepID=A0A1K2ILW7_9FLAO|nr:TonB-dependent receptor [Flaviramulus basaltis]SFZ93461.1 TonB-linked outer membrane protein, SusC/RagA family [Flaviramulus basaltis]